SLRGRECGIPGFHELLASHACSRLRVINVSPADTRCRWKAFQIRISGERLLQRLVRKTQPIEPLGFVERRLPRKCVSHRKTTFAAKPMEIGVFQNSAQRAFQFERVMGNHKAGRSYERSNAASVRDDNRRATNR